MLHVELVRITPRPVLVRLEAPNNGVPTLLEVLSGVLARRTITAAYVTARQAKAELNPVAAGPEAVLAPGWRPRGHRANLVEMGALTGHYPLPCARADELPQD